MKCETLFKFVESIGPEMLHFFGLTIGNKTLKFAKNQEVGLPRPMVLNLWVAAPLATLCLQKYLYYDP